MKEKEQWKEIKGFSRHEISNCGRIRRVAYSQGFQRKGHIVHLKFQTVVKKLFWNKSSKILQIDARNDEGKRTTLYPHRLVAEYFIPNDDPINKTAIVHKDLNTRNNHVSNLEWTTLSQKMLDDYKSGKRDRFKTWKTRHKRYKNGFKPKTKD